MTHIKILFIACISIPLLTRSYIDYESPFHPVVGNAGMVVSQNNLSSEIGIEILNMGGNCLLYTSPSPRDVEESRMPSSA